MKFLISIFSFAVIAALLAGCGDSSQQDEDLPTITAPTNQPPPPLVTFNIGITNLTADQPFSHPALLIHGSTFQAWEAGQPASTALETLAESGSPAGLLALPQVRGAVVAPGILLPGGSVDMQYSVTSNVELSATLVTMLVNTNDAFTGLTGFRVSNLMPGESRHWTLHAWDSGTEANDEAAANIPGPAGGGEGMNAARDDVDRVHIHPGVLSMHEMEGSALRAGHRFDNPVARVTLTRI